MDSSSPNQPEAQEVLELPSRSKVLVELELKTPPSPAPRRPAPIPPAPGSSNADSQDRSVKLQGTTDSLEATVQEKEPVSESDKTAGTAEKIQDHSTAVMEHKKADTKTVDAPPPPKAKKRSPRNRASSTLISESSETFEKLKHTASNLHRRSTGTLLVPEDGKNGSESLPIKKKPPIFPPAPPSSSSAASSSSDSTSVSLQSVPTCPPAATPTKPLSSSLSSLQSHFSNHKKRLGSAICREEWRLAKRDYIISEEEKVMSLTALVEEHSKSFPLAVTVVRGLEGQIFPRCTMNIHFLKQTNVIDVSDSLNQRYLIPYNSSAKLGVLYCPGVKTESYFFEKVLDIIQASDLPKVVTCTKKFKGKTEDSSVNANEILIVQEVLSQHAKSSKKSKLRVFSFTQQKEKILHGDTVGKFTTDPKLAGLYIPDILKYLPDSFPLSVRLFPEEGSDSSLPKSLTKDPLLLLDSTFETSLIVSCSLLPERGLSGSLARKADVEVPVSENIVVSLLNRDKSSSLETLHTKTLALWKELMSQEDESSVTMPQRLKVSPNDSAQHELFAKTRAGWGREGQFLKAPPLIENDQEGFSDLEDSQYTPLLLSASQSSEHYSTADDALRDEVEDEFEVATQDSDTDNKNTDSPSSDRYDRDWKRHQRLVRRLEGVELRVARAAPQDKFQRLVRRVEALELRLMTESSKALGNAGSREELNEEGPKRKGEEPGRERAGLSKREEELEKEVTMLREVVGSLEEQVKRMEREMKEMSEVTRSALLANVSVQQAKQTPEQNRSDLKSMNTEQIVKLLQSLGLQQYKALFESETITGEILMECDEEVLEQDLGMKDHAHSAKLMKVIRGEWSPLTLISDYSYVKFKSISKTVAL